MNVNELHDYQNHKNIGKFQPLSEIKSLNENVIRGKMYKEKYSKQESPTKFDQVMINITRGSNLQIIPVSEAVSPQHLIDSPLNSSMIDKPM
jgi:hypothetical protein